MQRFNESFHDFLKKEIMSRAAAFEISPNVEELKMIIKGIDVKGRVLSCNLRAEHSAPEARLFRKAGLLSCAEHVRQLGGESPLSNLMEVKD